MVRQTSIILIIGYLFISATFVNAHNHPIAEGENDNCPVYIISYSFNSDTAFNNAFVIDYAPEQTEYLQITKNESSYHIVCLSINNRAPPLSNQI